MTDAEKEQTKLTATFLNTLGTGSIVTAVIAPTVAFYFGLQGLGAIPPWNVFLSACIWLFVGLNLHMLGRMVLRRLR